jgi:oxygen-independent coproporphyrinogen-3 oxidase
MTKNKHLYVHIPFCNNICYYCDFTRCKYNEDLVEKYLDSLQFELSQRVDNFDIETIYIGGGTPSSLTELQLNKLLTMLKPYTNSVIEYTFEANPDSLTLNKIKLLKQFSINRISLGVQSTEQRLLKLMNRQHDQTMVEEVINNLNTMGIHNISIDLIYSLPTQTMDEWKNTIDETLLLDIKHISLYSLTIEENSVFNKKGYSNLDIDIETDMYFYAIETLNKAGINQYEIANFAVEGYQSKHNTAYWNYNDFYGIGLGSSCKINENRFDNTTNFIKYFNHNFIDIDYKLSTSDNMFEMVMMSLRMKKGLDKNLFKSRYGFDIDIVYQEQIKANVKKGNLINSDTNLKCTDSGLYILNTILEEFLLND